MITVDQALEILLDRVHPLDVETVPLEQAHNRILAEDIVADIDLPPFDRARMDGYAVRSADIAQAPRKLRVIGEVAAGARFRNPRRSILTALGTGPILTNDRLTGTLSCSGVHVS